MQRAPLVSSALALGFSEEEVNRATTYTLVTMIKERTQKQKKRKPVQRFFSDAVGNLAHFSQALQRKRSTVCTSASIITIQTEVDRRRINPGARRIINPLRVGLSTRTTPRPS